jgi:hemoglobin
MRNGRITVLVLFCFGLIACAPKDDQAASNTDTAAPAMAAATPQTLFDRLGGRTAIASVVDAFVANVAADTRVNKFFGRVAGDTSAMRQFKEKLVDQMCQGSGGPCTYAGLDMQTAHRGMGLADADFDAIVDDLVRALDGAGVAQKEKDDLLAILGPMRADIVTKK